MHCHRIRHRNLVAFIDEEVSAAARISYVEVVGGEMRPHELRRAVKSLVRRPT